MASGYLWYFANSLVSTKPFAVCSHKKEIEPLGTIQLCNYVITYAPTKIRPYAFLLTGVTPQFPSYHICAMSPESCLKWFDEIAKETKLPSPRDMPASKEPSSPTLLKRSTQSEQGTRGTGTSGDNRIRAKSKTLINIETNIQKRVTSTNFIDKILDELTLEDDDTYLDLFADDDTADGKLLQKAMKESGIDTQNQNDAPGERTQQKDSPAAPSKDFHSPTPARPITPVKPVTPLRKPPLPEAPGAPPRNPNTTTPARPISSGPERSAPAPAHFISSGPDKSSTIPTLSLSSGLETKSRTTSSSRLRERSKARTYTGVEPREFGTTSDDPAKPDLSKEQTTTTTEEKTETQQAIPVVDLNFDTSPPKDRVEELRGSGWKKPGLLSSSAPMASSNSSSPENLTASDSTTKQGIYERSERLNFLEKKWVMNAAPPKPRGNISGVHRNINAAAIIAMTANDRKIKFEKLKGTLLIAHCFSLLQTNTSHKEILTLFILYNKTLAQEVSAL